MVTEVKKKVKAAEYEALPEGPPTIIDGEIIKSPAPTPTHQAISGKDL